MHFKYSNIYESIVKNRHKQETSKNQEILNTDIKKNRCDKSSQFLCLFTDKKFVVVV